MTNIRLARSKPWSIFERIVLLTTLTLILVPVGCKKELTTIEPSDWSSPRIVVKYNNGENWNTIQ
jgi:hypothetical protein